MDQHSTTQTHGIAHRALALLASLAVITTSLLATADHAEAAPDVELYDTAWDMPFWAELGEVVTYFDHLEDSGYTGVWLSLMNHSSGIGVDGIVRETGTHQATFTNNQFDLDPTYRSHFETILDLADARGLRVGVLPMWGVHYLHDRTSTDNCAGVNQGPLQESNAFDWGQEVGNAFSSHPAVQYWILGGDNFCRPFESGTIWEEMANGLEAGGATQDMSYHTAGYRESHVLFADEDWVDFLSPQTSHCVEATTTEWFLQMLATFGKPVIAAEMRYETIEPAWDECPAHGEDDPVLPSDVLEDAEAALAAGVSGMLYGHNERWAWGRSGNGSENLGWASVQPSFGAAGEQLVLDLLGLGSSPPPTVPPTGSNPVIDVIARGKAGGEVIELEVAGQVVMTQTLGTSLQTFPWQSPIQVAPSDVRVLFTNDDGTARDAYIDAIAINGQRYETEAPTTQSKGTWSGTNCNTGFKQSPWLHCNGWVHYAQTPTSPPTTPPTTAPPQTGQTVFVHARGVAGTEVIQLEVAGQLVLIKTLSETLTAYGWNSPAPVAPSDVRVLFINDDGLTRDAYIDAITIDGVRYETEAATTESSGSWNGSCDQGFKQSSWLHCNGWFHYDQ